MAPTPPPPSGHKDKLPSAMAASSYIPSSSKDSKSLRKSLYHDFGRRRSSHRPSIDMPDRLKAGDDDAEDVTAPKPGSQKAKYIMNQSFFNLLTAAGSTTDFHERFDDPSSESEGEDKGEASQQQPKGKSKTKEEKRLSHRTQTKESTSSADSKHSRSSSRSKILAPIRRLRALKERHSTPEEDPMTSSQILAPKSKSEDDTPEASSAEPLLSRMIRGEEEMRASIHPDSTKGLAVGKLKVPDSTPTLAQRLMDIFNLDQPEEVISEYPCWFLQSVLLSGYLYITAKHVCYYAYLPKNAAAIEKSGFLAKRGHRNPRYNRYYFELKGDVLSYYKDRSEIYYPSGNIDLRYGISATVETESGSSHGKGTKEESTHIKLVTSKREYRFQADSPESAREWVKYLQKVIFRSHNDGDSVKILLPIANIIDVERTEFLDLADTVKIRVIDNDETYAIDEYWFSFFNHGKEAIRVLKIFVEESQTQQSETDSKADDESSRPSISTLPRPSITVEGTADPSQHPVTDIVRATIPARSPLDIRPGRRSTSNSRSSLDVRKSFDRRTSSDARRSASFDRRDARSRSPYSPASPSTLSPTDSPTVSSLGGEPSPIVRPFDDSNVSASQILNRSDVFQGPTSHNPRPSPSQEDLNRDSQDTARSVGHDQSRLQKQRVKDKSKSTPVLLTRTEQDRRSSTSAIQTFIRYGAYPLSRASVVADQIRGHSKHFGTRLANDSYIAYEKLSGMWQGGMKHYGPVEGMPPDDDDPEDEDESVTEHHTARFREHFALPESERLVASYFAFFHRVLPLYGKIYIGSKHFCFRSLLPGTRTKLIIPLSDIEGVNKEKGYRFGFPGIVITVRGHEEIFFDFRQFEPRDDCTVCLILATDHSRKTKTDMSEREDAEAAKAEFVALQKASIEEHPERALSPSRYTLENAIQPIIFDDPKASILNPKPTTPLHITCLTIGSRGDVQPYIALAKELMEDGHTVRIATHLEFKSWVESHGIEFAPVDGDPGELMRLCIEYGMFTYQFLREAHTKFRTWIDALLVSAWHACQKTDLLIESPSAMAGIHIAEALQIPYFRAFTMPWTKTRAYPHAFAVPEHKRGGPYNYLTYVLIDSVFWKGVASNVNRWRRNCLGLGPTSLDKMQPNKIPFLYCFSPAVVPPPLDYSDWIRVTGYWFLDEAKKFTPPADLAAFISKARADDKKLVYVGFGSILVEDSAAMTRTIVDAIVKADVRCILAKGWSDRIATGAGAHGQHNPADKSHDPTVAEFQLPDSIFQIKSCPHDWLFPQVDAAVHHGGSGTTGASLRAGVPTIVKPFFGDQFFWGSRIEDLGVGVYLKKLNVSMFAKALWAATRDERMRDRAYQLGEIIRSENGARSAVHAIYRDMDYARSLIKRHDRREELDGAIEEHWTFVEADSDIGGSMVSSQTSEVWDPVHGPGLVVEGK